MTQIRSNSPEFTAKELFILIGGGYALYTVGMAIASQLDYNEVNRRKK